MSATSSTAIIAALVGLAKAVRPLASRIADLARESSKSIGVATERAIKLSAISTTAELGELLAPNRALADMRRYEQQAVDQLRVQGGCLAQLDAEKTAVIAGILRAPLVVDDADRVQAALAAVEGAATKRELAAARTNLHRLVTAEHGRAWLTSLEDITRRAYEEIGFRPLATDARSEREIRMSAMRDDGKVLVSELRLAADGAPSMATEVVNGCGPECEGILANFDKALAEHVRGAAPVRKPTGGVYQLDAAVEFVKRRIRRAPLSVSDSKPRQTRRVVAQRRS